MSNRNMEHYWKRKTVMTFGKKLFADSCEEISFRKRYQMLTPQWIYLRQSFSNTLNAFGAETGIFRKDQGITMISRGSWCPGPLIRQAMALITQDKRVCQICLKVSTTAKEYNVTDMNEKLSF